MPRRVLKNKPLVEAIFELRWSLEKTQPGLTEDRHYPLLIGALYERIRDRYPYHEELNTARMPHQMLAHVVQHRFRVARDAWPLVQLGPGILTVNETDGYVWEGFESAAANSVEELLDAYAGVEQPLRVEGLTLRYIDAIEFDYEANDVFQFLSEQLKAKVELDPRLFEGERVRRTPSELDLRFNFPCAEPRGTIALRFFRGKKQGRDALVWETAVQSRGEGTPVDLQGIAMWLRQAHEVTDDWFFKMIEGELERRFE